MFNPADFSVEVIEKSKHGLVLFYVTADWAIQCQETTDAVIDQLRAESAVEVVVLDANTPGSSGLLRELGATNVPHFSFYLGGEVVEFLPGLHGIKELSEIIQKYSA